MKNDQANSAIGLDIGTSRIVVAGHNSEGFQFRSELNAFVPVPFSKMTERMLKKEQIPHMAQGSEIIIYGNESEKFADLFHLEARRPMNRGILNPGEPNGLTLLREIVQMMTKDERRKDRKLYFSVPAPSLGFNENVTYHEAALCELLNDLGYDVQSINEGLAVIYAELEETNYTGIGISCGGGLCNLCLAYLSAPLFSFSISKAGDYIDSSVASVTNELATRVRITKETAFHLNGHFTGKIQQALNVYYQDMIQAVVAGLKEAFSNSLNVPKLGRPLPIVLSGGSTLTEGFCARFEKSLRAGELPVSISKIIAAKDPLNTTAKGALVAAMCEV
jgi:actin-like ATPase involved in cell morphogenesis